MIDVEKYLSGFYRGTKDPSLRAMKYFLNKFGDFEKEMKFIHIAGTNGKGSCTEMLSNILIKQGYKIGKFMSPHLIRYNERISINGKEISNKEMSDIIEEIQPMIESYNKNEDTKVTLFELETIMALLYFYRKKVDLVILEVGLGGLYDCTNIITKPLVSIITSIGYDHMKILGNTLQEIAYQKAGIIKKESNTVIFEQEKEVNKIFIEECRKKRNKIHIVKKSELQNYSFDNIYQYFDYKDMKKLCINLKGKVQIKNAALCIETSKILSQQGYRIDIDNIREGLKTVIHKGRMERLNSNPLIIYDGAHNKPAIENLLEMVNMYYSKMKRVYIISILARKDYNTILKLLSEDKNAIFIMTSGNKADKYATSDELYECMKKYVKNNRIYKKDLRTAIQDSINGAQDIVSFVIGSFYTYGTVVKKIKEIKEK